MPIHSDLEGAFTLPDPMAALESAMTGEVKRDHGRAVALPPSVRIASIVQPETRG
ncbi:hypothetical protein SAMN02982917_6352 [Azospirillum oryzae]|uniref:Uncharacterized protein n=1 Tax=Azospirillum oryzae TaxID=286727 RepID=A0A1X7HL81_9PROT|nr:hypothetical protein [Azospirillum oryzae]SMF88337.1 hypothetical protein SAMN02982917_6352 [Azospirillum oryzae]